jgi:hypothetical protein
MRDSHISRYKKTSKVSTFKDTHSRPTKKLRPDISVYTKLLDPSSHKVPEFGITSNNKIAQLLQKTSEAKGLGKISSLLQDGVVRSQLDSRIPSTQANSVADLKSEEEDDLARIA